MKASRWGLALLTLMALAACGEKPQTIGSAPRKDAPRYQGVGDSPFAQPGWKAGDANGWTQQLRARGQYGQNEYNRTHP